MLTQKKKIIFLLITLFLIGLSFQPIFAYYHEQAGQTQTEGQRRTALEEQKKRLEAERAKLEAELKKEREVKQGREGSNLKSRTRLEQKYYIELQKTSPTASTTVRDAYQKEKEILKSRLSDNVADWPSLTSEQRKERLKKIKDILEDNKERTKASRDEIKKKLQELSSDKEDELRLSQEELREKTKELLSERKAQIAEKLSKQLNFINDKITDNYLRHLEKWDSLLDKMESRAKNLSEESYDVSEINVKIASARNAIVKAQEQVLIQKAKIYSVKIEDEKSVGGVFSKARQELRDDLAVLKKDVMEPIKEILRDIHKSFKALTKRAAEDKPKITEEQNE